MNNKGIVIGVIVVIVLVVLGYVFLAKDNEQINISGSPTATAVESVSVSPSTSASVSPSTSTSPSTSVSPSKSPTKTPTPTPTTVTIMYSDAGFSPANVTIAKGSTVVFKNTGTADMWPASAQHPTHMLYPVHGTCFSGLFEGCHVASGASYTMKFDVVGSWGYHDHLNAQHFGKITVQ